MAHPRVRRRGPARDADQRRAVDGAEPALQPGPQREPPAGDRPRAARHTHAVGADRGSARQPADIRARPRAHPVAVAGRRSARRDAAAGSRPGGARRLRGCCRGAGRRIQRAAGTRHRPPGVWPRASGARWHPPLRGARAGVVGRGAGRHGGRRVCALGRGDARAAVVVLRALPRRRARQRRTHDRRQVESRAGVAAAVLFDALRSARTRPHAADLRLPLRPALDPGAARRLDRAAGRHHRVERDATAPPARTPSAGRGGAARRVGLPQGDGGLDADRHACARPRRPPHLRQLRLLPHDRLQRGRAARSQAADALLGPGKAGADLRAAPPDHDQRQRQRRHRGAPAAQERRNPRRPRLRGAADRRFRPPRRLDGFGARHHRTEARARTGPPAGGAPAAELAPDHHGRDGVHARARAQPAARGDRKLHHGLHQPPAGRGAARPQRAARRAPAHRPSGPARRRDHPPGARFRAPIRTQARGARPRRGDPRRHRPDRGRRAQARHADPQRARRRPAAGAGGRGDDRADRRQPGAQRDGLDARHPASRARRRRAHRARGPLRHRHRRRPRRRHSRRNRRAAIRALLHHQAGGHGHGTQHLPLDRRAAPRPPGLRIAAGRRYHLPLSLPVDAEFE